MKRTDVNPAKNEALPLLAGFDLNLLRVLLALDRTRHVTRAAELLQMSQSGFSTALARLRRHCDDPLFVRSADGMLPTARAQGMILRASDLMGLLHSDVAQAHEFDPAQTSTEFSLGLADLGEIVILPQLMARLESVAPGARVASHVMPDGELQTAMAAGQIDLAVGYYPEIAGQDYFQQRLYSHTFACMVRRDHPLVAGQLTREAYQQLGHVLVTSPSRSGALFRTTLIEMGIERRVVLRTPHNLSLPSIIEATDLIATVPLAVGARFAERADVRLLPLPFQPRLFPVQQHWHRRFQQDPRHRWLREQMAQLFNDDTDIWRDLEQRLYGDTLRAR